MPLRGSLFRKIEQHKEKRRQAEVQAIKAEAIREGQELKRLRSERIQKEGKAILEETLATERRRIAEAKSRAKRAKGPSITSRVGKFLVTKSSTPTTRKAASRGGKLIAKELGIKTAKKRGPKKRKKRAKVKKSALEGGGFGF